MDNVSHKFFGLLQINRIKKNLMFFLMVLCFNFFVTGHAFSQQSEADSLLKIISSTANDSLKFNSYIRLFSITSKQDLSKSNEYLLNAESIAHNKESVYYKGTVLYNRSAYFNYKGLFDSTYFYGKKAYELLKDSPFKKAIALSLSNMATGMGQQNAKKIEIYYQVEKIYDELKDTTGWLFVYNNLSRNYTYLHKFDSAVYYSEKALNLCRLQNNDFNISTSLQQLANIYFEKHNFDKAVETAIEAIVYSRKAKNVSSEIWLLITLGSIYAQQNEFNTSLQYYDEAHDKSMASGFKKHLSRIYLEAGGVHLAMKDYIRAENNFNQARDYNHLSKSQYGRMATLSSFCDLHLAKKEYLKVISSAREGVAIGKELNVGPDLIHMINIMGIAFLNLNQYDSALFYSNQSYQMSVEYNDGLKISEVAQTLAEIYEKQGNYTQALYFYRQYKSNSDSIYNVEKAQIIADAEKKYQVVKSKEEIARLNAEKTSKELELKNHLFQINIQQSEAAQKEISLMLLSRESEVKDLELSRISSIAQVKESEVTFKNKELQVANAENLLNKLNSKQELLVRNITLLIALLTTLFGILFFIWFRKQKELQARQSLLTERLRISRELHDDLGSTLSSISVYSDVAKNRAIKNVGTEEVLSKISYASRELIDKMSDIVWSLNPENETLEQLKNRMVAFAAIMFTPSNINFSFDMDSELENHTIPVESRKNVYLIFKEAVHNIVKYAKCTDVLITIHKTEKGILFCINDNGAGFKMEVTRNGNGNGKAVTDNVLGGNGIRNMHARANSINSLLSINSQPGKGTAITLLI